MLLVGFTVAPDAVVASKALINTALNSRPTYVCKRTYVSQYNKYFYDTHMNIILIRNTYIQLYATSTISTIHYASCVAIH